MYAWLVSVKFKKNPILYHTYQILILGSAGYKY